MVEVNYTTKITNEKNVIQEFLIKCYCNIALVCLRQKEYKHAIEACNDILKMEPYHAKALYLRARSRMEPMSSGGTEYELAMKDLKLAHTHANAYANANTNSNTNAYCSDDKTIM